MTLKEAIYKHDGEVLRIGAKNNFIYVARSSSRTYGVIEKLSEKERKRLVRELKKTKNHANNFDKDWEKIARNRLKSIVTNDKYEKIIAKISKEREKIEREKKRDLKATEHRLHTLTTRLYNFTPFLEREVKEMYKSDVNDDIIIIFEGEEQGDYWTQEEYRKAKNE